MTPAHGKACDVSFEQPVPEGCRRLAWNGLSFCIPDEWEMSGYDFPQKDISRVEIADIYCRRMQVEWGRGDVSPSHVRRLVKRYEDQSKSMTLKAENHEGIEGLPAGWAATHYRFRESGPDDSKRRLEVQAQDLMTAIYQDSASSLFVFFIIWFFPDVAETPGDVIRQVALTFQDHGSERVVPWILFDLSFGMPATFSLEKASFDIGSKMWIFNWRSRQVLMWHLSCADAFLNKNVSAAKWATAHLNTRAGLKGVRFEEDREGGVRARRKWHHPLGHRSEIARWCFQYQVDILHEPDKNCLTVRVFLYRTADDLRHLPTLIDN